MAELSHTDVDTILRTLDQMQDQEIHLEIGELNLHVATASESSAAPASPAQLTAAQPAAPPAAAPASERITFPPGLVAVRALTIGTFFRVELPARSRTPKSAIASKPSSGRRHKPRPLDGARMSARKHSFIRAS